VLLDRIKRHGKREIGQVNVWTAHLVHRHLVLFELVIRDALLELLLHHLMRQRVMLRETSDRYGLQTRQELLVPLVSASLPREGVVVEAVVVAIVAVSGGELRVRLEIRFVLFVKERVLLCETRFHRSGRPRIRHSRPTQHGGTYDQRGQGSLLFHGIPWFKSLAHYSGDPAAAGQRPPPRSVHSPPADDLLLLLSQLFDAEPDHIASLQVNRVRLVSQTHSGRRSRSNDISGLQCHEPAVIAHDTGATENHGACITRLHPPPVYVEPHVELLHIAHFIPCDQPRAHRTKRVATLALIPCPAAFQLEFTL